MTDENSKNLFEKMPRAEGLTATARLFILALHPNESLSIGEMSEYTGSTPYNIQRLGSKLIKRGLVARTRLGGITKYSLPTTTTTTPTSSQSPTPDSTATVNAE